VPQRSKHNNGHTLLSAPYGIYSTADGFLGIAMVPLSQLSTALDCKDLTRYNQEEAFSKRDEIKQMLNKHLSAQPTSSWIKKLQQQNIWSTEVFNWNQMKNHEAYKVLQMEQTISSEQKKFVTTRCPIRINNKKLVSPKPAPGLGQDNEKLLIELNKQTA
jgi:crotonobetainyl-CoA:carnitine CoA-transferase CaiB-like acyl-CoA transferase